MNRENIQHYVQATTKMPIEKARFTVKNIRAAFRLNPVRKDHNTVFNEQFCNQFIPQDSINAA